MVCAVYAEYCRCYELDLQCFPFGYVDRYMWLGAYHKGERFTDTIETYDHMCTTCGVWCTVFVDIKDFGDFHGNYFGNI